MWNIPLAVITRFGPWFGRLAKASPALLANLVNKLRASGAQVGSSASDIVAYVKSSPLNAALVFATLASLGASVADLFSAEDRKDPEVRSQVARLEQTTSVVDVVARSNAHGTILKIAAESEKLTTGISAKEVDLAVAVEVLGFARRFFGSPSAAIKAHGMMQAFFEMPLQDVEAGYRQLRT